MILYSMCYTPVPFNESVVVMLSINSLHLLIYGLQLHYWLQSILIIFCRLSKQKKLNNARFGCYSIWSFICNAVWIVFQYFLKWIVYMYTWMSVRECDFLFCKCVMSVAVSFFIFLRWPCGDALSLIPVKKSDENILWLIYFINRFEVFKTFAAYWIMEKQECS